ncbi:gamma-glutamyl-gamma-aminobutyrate hydrolase family protein [Hankyongella ginsenosidimutans]|uniref:Gamma-glutamyl-gamma-aminobutyrate hydrolase family protein n=1 Tax=Hankyongella ginsenosidimutans TaxID=1763828 RepID=A0A4D7C6W5_9SPHN|nr:gamma-glutamyl-gamma-aminobutyrate hydrolase family protein [Hankyongella ginsenosidimutans]QCI78778.1 gamma-glutamyl-gamma-aminobutyrate hydrolase family protein [Hankyongella ginsenosidimutans]
MRPVLGIIACNRSSGQEMAQQVQNRYIVKALKYADVAGLIVPALPDLIDAREIAPRLDGILLTGSPSNIAPGRYGDAEPGEGPFDVDRDAMVPALVDAMTARGRPVFGICRGFQELNVAFGGTLRRDLGPAHHADEKTQLGPMFAHGHPVSLTPGGLLAAMLGVAEIQVNSVHYQGIDRLGEGLTVEAHAPDGLPEAFSARVGGAPVLAVQWHPEWDADENPHSQAYFRALGRALRGDPLSGQSG